MKKRVYCMAIFKKLRDKVTSPQANIVLKFTKPSYAAGENVEGTLTLSSSEDFEASEVRCEILCVEEERETRRVYDQSMRIWEDEEYWDTSVLFSARPALSGPMHVNNGLVQDFPFSFSLAVSGPVTCRSFDRKITWTVKGAVAVNGRPDVTSRTTELQVTPRSVSRIIRVREIIREVILTPCKHCGNLMPETDTICPHCGAKRIS